MFLATQTQHISISRFVFFSLLSDLGVYLRNKDSSERVPVCVLSVSISQVAYSEKPFPSWHSPISSLQLCADVCGNRSDMFLSQNYDNTIQLNYCTLNTSAWLLQTSTFILKLNMYLFCVASMVIFKDAFTEVLSVTAAARLHILRVHCCSIVRRLCVVNLAGADSELCVCNAVSLRLSCSVWRFIRVYLCVG